MKSNIKLRSYFEDGMTSLDNSIFFDNNLTDTEKVIFTIITILNSRNDKFCFATNEQLAELSNKSISGIKCAITKLNSKKYILVDMLQNRTPFKRRIFTFERHYQMWKDGTLPKDCIFKTAQRKIQDLNLEEIKKSFPKFRKFMKMNLNEQEFTVSSENLFLALKKIKIRDNGYYHSVTDRRDLNKEEAAEFERLMFNKRAEIIEAYIKNEELTKYS